MLSILIPTYHYNAYPLAKELFQQALKCNINFEILVYDDASKSKLNIENKTINNLYHCTFKELPNNIGRSSIRNLLGTKALYDNLLFVDAGTYPKEKEFIKDYIKYLNTKVVIGGMVSKIKSPKKPFKLRWLYTNKREHKTLCSSNFFIDKHTFLSYPFDESLKKYGYEDVLFFETLNKNNIKCKQIKNPVIHEADDGANAFIKKTEYAIENLIQLLNQGKLDRSQNKTSKVFERLCKLKLNTFIAYLFKLSKSMLKKNFNSNYPSLFLFDLYKLGYFCLLKTKN